MPSDQSDPVAVLLDYVAAYAWKNPPFAQRAESALAEIERAMSAVALVGDRRLPSRFWAHVAVNPFGCWTWRGSLPPPGYGRFSLNKVFGMAHRIAYEALVGPIGTGLVIDHLCRNRSCVRPDHLEPVSTRENVLRGNTVPAANRAKVACRRGHAFAPENTYVDSLGKRACRTCARERDRRRRALRRGLANAPTAAGAEP